MKKQLLISILILSLSACSSATKQSEKTEADSKETTQQTSTADIPQKTSLGSGFSSGADLSEYYQDGEYVYLDKYRLDDADYDSFEVVKQKHDQGLTNHVYAKDNKGVYYQNQRLIGAYPASFEAFPRGYSKDSSAVYWVVTKTELNPSYFRLLRNPFRAFPDEEIPEYATDDKLVYCNGKKIEGADADSFEIVSDIKAKDSQQEYEFCQPSP